MTEQEFWCIIYSEQMFGGGLTERTVLHSDLNNFFASVECRLDPSLRGRPIAVAGDPEARHGIVLAKSEEAKRCGVTTGETLWQARSKCPDILFVPPHYDKYIEFSDAVRGIYGDFTDRVESYGLDECWLDVTGSRRLFGDGSCIANAIRSRVKKELGVTVSVGVSFNKIFAKLGSDMKKPDAVTVIDRDSFREVVWPLPVGDLLYVGRSAVAKLARYGIRTIGDLALADRVFLSYLLGKSGEMLHSFANGEDMSPVSNIGAKSLIKSVSCGSTTPRDMVTSDEVKILLTELSESVSARLRRYGFMCRCVQLHIRESDLSSVVRQKKLGYPCHTAKAIFTAAYELYAENHGFSRPVRSLSVCACDLDYCESEQLSFDPDIEKIQRRENLESAVDALREKYGKGAIVSALSMTAPELCSVSLKNHPGILPGRMKT